MRHCFGEDVRPSCSWQRQTDARCCRGRASAGGRVRRRRQNNPPRCPSPRDSRLPAVLLPPGLDSAEGVQPILRRNLALRPLSPKLRVPSAIPMPPPIPWRRVQGAMWTPVGHGRRTTTSRITGSTWRRSMRPHFDYCHSLMVDRSPTETCLSRAHVHCPPAPSSAVEKLNAMRCPLYSSPVIAPLRGIELTLTTSDDQSKCPSTGGGKQCRYREPTLVVASCYRLTK